MSISTSPSYERPDHDPGEPRVEPGIVTVITAEEIAAAYLGGPNGEAALRVARGIAEVALIRPQLPVEHFQGLLTERLSGEADQAA